MKNFLKKIRELWKTPKYHALLALGLWFLFFFVCFLSLFIMKNLKKPVILEEPNYSLDNYECKYQISINDKIYNLVGNRYKTKELVEVLNPPQTFIVVESQNIEMLKGIDFTSLRLDYLVNLTNNALDKKTINYQNNGSKTTYQINGSSLKIIDIPLTNELVYLSIEKENNKVKKIVLDITSIMSKQDKSINNYKIEMEYSKYNRIRDFAVD